MATSHDFPCTGTFSMHTMDDGPVSEGSRSQGGPLSGDPPVGGDGGAQDGAGQRGALVDAVQELRQHVQRVYEAAGKPTMRALEAQSRRNGDPFAASTVSNVLSRPETVRSDTLLKVVDACCQLG